MNTRKPIFRSSRLLFLAAKSLYGLASVLIVIALVLGARIIPASASPGEFGNPAQTTFCNLGSQGTIVKVESPPWTFTADNGGFISIVGIKAGNGCPTVFRANGSNTCYGISGIGTSKVTVWQVSDAPSSCRDISHLEIVIKDPAPTPVEPTLTPVGSTATPVNPTATPVDPTATPVDPTATPVDPTATPVDEPTTIVTEQLRRNFSPVPTLIVPAEGNDELLIPVTGFMAPFSTADTLTKKSVYAKTSSSLSLMFFGFGLIFNGAAIFKKRKEEE